MNYPTFTLKRGEKLTAEIIQVINDHVDKLVSPARIDGLTRFTINDDIFDIYTDKLTIYLDIGVHTNHNLPAYVGKLSCRQIKMYKPLAYASTNGATINTWAGASMLTGFTVSVKYGLPIPPNCVEQIATGMIILIID